MRAYIIRRLLLVIPTLFLVSIIVFFSIRLIPGDVVELMVQEHEVSGLDRDMIRHRLGLDVPVYVQYGRWIYGIFTRFDLGKSLWGDVSVTDEILNRWPVSFELGVIAIVVGLLIALPIGIYSAVRQDTGGDYVGRTIAIACITLPSFWLGTMVMVYPSVWWGWTPPLRYVPFLDDPLSNIQQFLIPGVILGMVMSGVTMRMTRTMMLEVLRQDYIRTAWSKGLTERVVVARHALKNALIPVVTIVGLQLPVLIGGSIVLEQIFVLPGIGVLILQIINTRDYIMLSGINLFMATVVLFINLAVDLTYGWLDPRVHYR